MRMYATVGFSFNSMVNFSRAKRKGCSTDFSTLANEDQQVRAIFSSVGMRDNYGKRRVALNEATRVDGGGKEASESFSYSQKSDVSAWWFTTAVEFSSEAGCFSLFPDGSRNSFAQKCCTHARTVAYKRRSALLRHFSVNLWWRIQNMKTPSQQVWTQLLNIQLSSSHHLCLLPP